MLRLFLLVLLLSVPAYAQNKDPFRSSGLPVPRFVSTASDTVFVRAGPALRYPIKWVLKKEGLPLEVVQEFDTWRKVRDIKGDEGWVHQSLLKGRRTAIIQSAAEPVALRKKPQDGARVMARLEPGVVVYLDECRADWCAVNAETYKGWTPRASLWGVYDGETLE